jgi:signal transduction histidine kinase
MRFRQGDPRERAQIGWLFLALLFNLAVSALPAEWPGLVGAAFISVALGFAVLRHGLYDLERVFNRAAVYGAVTTAVVAVFALFAGLLGNRINDNALGAVLASIVVALGIGPAREWLQRSVDRLMYGEQLNPYGALASIARQLEETPEGSSVLAAVTTAVSETLRLPYAGIILSGQSKPVVSCGTRPDRTVALPLVHAGHEVGQLSVGLRRGERTLSWRDKALLADFARLVAAAAHEVTLASDLRRSRERLVMAREEERRRLRRELHDGVGPALAGLALEVAAANRAASRGDPSATVLLSRAELDVEGCLADVRRISHDLRPAALDELGLVGALEQRAGSVTDASSGALLVLVDAEQVPALPAAVEVAAYRIATEALTNAVRHAQASRCTIRVTADGSLHVEVSDDGRGLPSPITPGLGLSSMAERTAEVGGNFEVESVPGAGTTIRAELPLAVTG